MTVPRRRCPRCEKTKPQTRAYFYFKTNGNWDTWCKTCKKEWNALERQRRRDAEYKLRAGLPLTARERRAAEAAENQRAAQRAYLKRKAQDPQWVAEHAAREKAYRDKDRETVRENARIAYRIRVGGERTNKPTKSHNHFRVKPTDGERLNPEPFAAWLVQQFPSLDDAVSALRVERRDVLDVWERRVPHITLSWVDRALIGYGRPDILNALYPVTV